MQFDFFREKGKLNVWFKKDRRIFVKHNGCLIEDNKRATITNGDNLVEQKIDVRFFKLAKKK